MIGLLSEPAPQNAETIQFSSMTKAQLLNYAEDNGVEGVSSSMKRAQIVEILEGAE